jgi:hypothetical protein
VKHFLVKHIWRRRVLIVLLFIIAIIVLTARLRGHAWPF